MPRLLLILLLLATHAQAQRPSAQSQRPSAQSQRSSTQAPPPSAQPQPQAQAPGASQLLNVGDIPFDPVLDDPNFHLNDSTCVFQYYNSDSWWLDHKDGYRELFEKATCESLSPAAPTQSGWLTIRFIVNVEGETGRFRTFGMDSLYQPFHFDPRLMACLLATVKTAHWQPAHYRAQVYDTYQYITFHLDRGRIVDIMP